MNLTKDNIITQIHHELLAWQALHLSPKSILGDNVSKIQLENAKKYKELLPAKNTTVQDLLHFVGGTQDVFFTHYQASFGINGPTAPFLSAVSLFRNELLKDTMPLSFNEKAQEELINTQFNTSTFERPPSPISDSQTHGLMIAVQTDNQPMVSFLLNPTLLAVIHFQEEIDLLLSAAQSLNVRNQLTKAYLDEFGKTLDKNGLNKLLSPLNTVEDWCFLYDNLTPTQQALLLSISSDHFWCTILKTNQHIATIKAKLAPPAFDSVMHQRFNQSAPIDNAEMLLKYLQTLSLRDRETYVVKQTVLLDTLIFNTNRPLIQRDRDLSAFFKMLNLTLKNNQLTIADLYGDTKTLTPMRDAFNTLINVLWSAPELTPSEKIASILRCKACLVAPPDKRATFVNEAKSPIQAQNDAIMNQGGFFKKWLLRFNRFMSSLFPKWPWKPKEFHFCTAATTFLEQMRACKERYNDFLLEDNSGIPEEALNALAKEKYSDFLTALGDNAFAKICSDTAGQHPLFRTITTPLLRKLIPLLPQKSIDHLLKKQPNQALPPLLALLLPPHNLSLDELLILLPQSKNSLFNALFKHPDWLSALTENPFGPTLTNIEACFSGKRIKPEALGTLLNKHPIEHYKLISALFHGDQRTHQLSPADIGQIANKLPRKKLVSFYEHFSPANMSITDLATLISSIEGTQKRKTWITKWTDQTTAQPCSWSDDLLILLPHLNDTHLKVITLSPRTPWHSLLEASNELSPNQWNDCMDAVLANPARFIPPNEPGLAALITGKNITHDNAKLILNALHEATAADRTALLNALENPIVGQLLQHMQLDFTALTATPSDIQGFINGLSTRFIDLINDQQRQLELSVKNLIKQLNDPNTGFFILHQEACQGTDPKWVTRSMKNMSECIATIQQRYETLATLYNVGNEPLPVHYNLKKSIDDMLTMINQLKPADSIYLNVNGTETTLTEAVQTLQKGMISILDKNTKSHERYILKYGKNPQAQSEVEQSIDVLQSAIQQDFETLYSTVQALINDIQTKEDKVNKPTASSSIRFLIEHMILIKTTLNKVCDAQKEKRLTQPQMKRFIDLHVRLNDLYKILRSDPNLINPKTSLLGWLSGANANQTQLTTALCQNLAGQVLDLIGKNTDSEVTNKLLAFDHRIQSNNLTSESRKKLYFELLYSADTHQTNIIDALNTPVGMLLIKYGYCPFDLLMAHAHDSKAINDLLQSTLKTLIMDQQGRLFNQELQDLHQLALTEQPDAIKEIIKHTVLKDRDASMPLIQTMDNNLTTLIDLLSNPKKVWSINPLYFLSFSMAPEYDVHQINQCISNIRNTLTSLQQTIEHAKGIGGDQALSDLANQLNHVLDKITTELDSKNPYLDATYSRDTYLRALTGREAFTNLIEPIRSVIDIASPKPKSSPSP